MNKNIAFSRLIRRATAALLLLGVLLLPKFLKAQEDLNEIYLKAYDLVKNNQTEESIKLLEEVMDVNGYFENVYAMFAFNYLLKGDLIQAGTYLKATEDLGETSIYPVFMSANLKVFEGKLGEAKALIERALQYKQLDSDIQDFNDAWDTFIRFDKKASDFQQLKSWLPTVKVSNLTYLSALQAYEKAQALAMEGKDKETLSAFNEALEGLNKLSPKGQNTAYKWQSEIGNNLFYSGSVEAGGQLIENAFRNTISNEAIGSYVKTLAAFYYTTYLEYVGNFSLNKQVIDQALPYSRRLLSLNLSGQLLMKKSSLLMAQGLDKENLAVGNQILELGINMKNDFFKAQGYNTIGSSYLVSTNPADRAKAKQNLEQANTIATTNGFIYLAESIQGNLAITYWQSGQRDKAVQTYQTLVNSLLSQGRQQDAIVNLNNVGSMFFFTKEYAKAIPYFEKAISISEEFRAQLDGQNRITYLQSQLSAYQFLTYCYARTNDGAGLFNSIDQQRARVLTERMTLRKKVDKTTLQKFQATLKSDEVALFYSLTEPGAVAINVVTKDKTYAVLKEFFKEFVELNQRYFDRLRRQDMERIGFRLPMNARVVGDRILIENDIANMFNQEDFELLVEFTRQVLQDDKPENAEIKTEFLNTFYKFLIEPVSNLIAGKRKLIISPDGILNFIPFEALVTNQGKFLIEDVGIRYMQSASVGGVINSRKYADNRKPMLAMGGAIYDEMSTQSDPIRSVARLQEMNFMAEDNVAQGLSQRKVYAALGFGKMNYLPGTLTEVLAMANTIPGADVYTGLEMDEAFLKQLSTEGKLANYKVLHLATHGFAISEIPQLSGIAMSILKDEKDGEDGYLTVPEISSLKLNADLVVLSACETGLGKIYGGEGVMGLTQSLILAGAKGAAVSLWAVNDASTMYFMAGMYELVEVSDMTYADAIDAMKRRFIKGDFGDAFKGTKYWAPFVHYGN
ncbi:CHAT domain-containing protein [Roseivirga echinicomitans]